MYAKFLCALWSIERASSIHDADKRTRAEGASFNVGRVYWRSFENNPVHGAPDSDSHGGGRTGTAFDLWSGCRIDADLVRTRSAVIEEIAERVETTLPGYLWLVCETDDGDVLGCAAEGSLRSTPPYRWTVELSVYVADAARNTGVDTALYVSLLDILELQGYRSAYAVVTLPNPASVGLHERLGFEPIGTVPAVGYKHGEWHDIQWWYRQLAAHSANPDPPQPLTAVRGTPEFDQALEPETGEHER